MLLVRLLANTMFPDLPPMGRRACYRRMVSRLNRQLKTVEIQMCSFNGWAGIDPKSVPVRAKHVYNRAFLNLMSTENGKRPRILSSSEKRQLRFPNNADRMTCRENFVAVANQRANQRANQEADQEADQEVVKEAYTPLELLRMELDAPQYDLVRDRLTV